MSFYDDSGYKIGVYHNMTADELSVLEKWKIRLTVYVTKDVTTRHRSIFWLDGIDESKSKYNKHKRDKKV